VLKGNLPRIAVVPAHPQDMLLLLRRQPFLAVAVQVIDTVAMQVLRHPMPQGQEHMPRWSATEPRRQPHLLIPPEEAALPLTAGPGIDRRPKIPVVRQFPSRTVAQALPATRTVRQEAEGEPLPHIAEVVFRCHQTKKYG